MLLTADSTASTVKVLSMGQKVILETFFTFKKQPVDCKYCVLGVQSFLFLFRAETPAPNNLREGFLWFSF